MGFVKTLEEIGASMRATADFYDARMLMVFWETKVDILARLLPPPLQPTAQPLVTAFVADYPRTNFDVAYRESALFIRASFQGVEGNYCLAMPVTNDIAMAGGREIFGFPKKIGDVHFFREGQSAGGWTERRGIRFMELRAKLTGTFNAANAQDFLAAMNPGEDGAIHAVSYNFKHFPAPEGGGFDYRPRLVRQVTALHPKEVVLGEAEIELCPSAYDPWADVEVMRVLGAVLLVGDNSMLAGEVVAECDTVEFAPYAFLKWDMA